MQDSDDREDVGKSGSSSVTIGWYFAPPYLPSSFSHKDFETLDKTIAGHCRTFGSLGYSFLCYPIGGLERFYWEPCESNSPPKLHLPDLQLRGNLWASYVNCCVSRWIDVDSEVDHLAHLSEVHLKQEINYAIYLGIRSLIIPMMRHSSSPKLAAILKHYLWNTESHLQFWVVLPTNIKCFHGNLKPDIWSIWADFRSDCGNYPNRLSVGLKLTEDVDEEFSDPKLVRRWKSEPLILLTLDLDLFVNDGTNLALSSFHMGLLGQILSLKSDQRHILVSSPTLENSVPFKMSAIIQKVVDSVEMSQDASESEYTDALQVPLQPLSDNLDSIVYQTFEEDRVKYDHYQKAIGAALVDLVNHVGLGRVNLFVLGAGRGPLVTAVINADLEIKRSNRLDFELIILAVEKNANACVSLEYCNERMWANSVRIVRCDMRQLQGELTMLGSNVRPDIVVSELLGSFGDNELSPECLDGVTGLFLPHTICIPQSYHNYVVPIQSLRMYQSIVADERSFWTRKFPGRGRDLKNPGIMTDLLYVVQLSEYYPLNEEPMPCFEFSHPNAGRSNARNARLSFNLDTFPSELTGFAGYFDVVLYKDVFLSTHPQRHTPGMASWFPALFPLRTPIRCLPGMSVEFVISRKVDSDGVWYEWFVEHGDQTSGLRTQSETQNENGESQFMRLSS